MLRSPLSRCFSIQCICFVPSILQQTLSNFHRRSSPRARVRSSHEKGARWELETRQRVRPSRTGLLRSYQPDPPSPGLPGCWCSRRLQGCKGGGGGTRTAPSLHRTRHFIVSQLLLVIASSSLTYGIPWWLTRERICLQCSCCSVAQSCPTLCDPIDCRLPCPSPSPRICSNRCPSSR